MVVETTGINLATRDAPSDYTDLIISPRPSRGYELSVGNSFTKVSRLGAEKNCVGQTDRHYVIYI